MRTYLFELFLEHLGVEVAERAGLERPAQDFAEYRSDRPGVKCGLLDIVLDAGRTGFLAGEPGRVPSRVPPKRVRVDLGPGGARGIAPHDHPPKDRSGLDARHGQAFNTTSSMGRLTLNVLLSFAQFEREVTGERIRDKIAASKAKGMWMGGTLLLGYDPPTDLARTLVINPAEAETVRLIFTTYLRLKSVHALQHWLKDQGIRSKRRITAKGRIGAVSRMRTCL